MLPFQERKNFRKFLYSRTNILVLLILLVLTGRGAWNVHEKAVIARSERDQSQRELVEVTDRKSTLEVSLRRLTSEQGLEDELRQKFAVAREGEEVVVIVDEDPKKGKNGDGVVEKSFWQSFVSFFTNK